MKLILLFILLPLKSLYIPLNRRKSHHYWSLPIDSKISLIPIFIIPYLLHHVGVVFTGLALWNTQFINPFLMSLIIGYVVAVIFWYFVPNGVHRPSVPQKSLFAPLIKLTYTNDGDTNGFPSAHIFVALLCGHYLTQAFSFFTPYIWTSIGLVVLSVLFTKQHYIIDIVGGILVYLLSFFLSGVVLYSLL